MSHSPRPAMKTPSSRSSRSDTVSGPHSHRPSSPVDFRGRTSTQKVDDCFSDTLRDCGSTKIGKYILGRSTRREALPRCRSPLMRYLRPSGVSNLYSASCASSNGCPCNWQSSALRATTRIYSCVVATASDCRPRGLLITHTWQRKASSPNTSSHSLRRFSTSWSSILMKITPSSDSRFRAR